MEHSVLREIVLVLGLSAASAYAMRKLGIPAITGYILAGILVGPGGLGLVIDREPIQFLAEAGVILLLFAVGLKLSPRELSRLGGFAFGSGALQVIVTAAGTAALAYALGLGLAEGIVWGYLVALSSTALVLSILEERGESDTAEGRWMLGVLLFQDLAVVPIMISLPLLAGLGQISWVDVGLLLGKTLLILVLVVAGAHFVLPRLTERVVRVRSKELFTLTALVAAFGTALLMAEFGLSMALGAFLAGVVLSESEYAQQILAEIAPLRDAFNSLFFVSVGMLVEPSLWLREPALSLSLFCLMVMLKGAWIGLLALVSHRSARLALIAAAGLAHVGEFSFVIAGVALALGLFEEDHHRLFLAVSVPTMLLAPLALTAAARLRYRPLARGRAHGAVDGMPVLEKATLKDKVIVVGFGLNGRNVARVLRLLEVPYVVLELNPASVRSLRRAGEPVLYGDASRELVLRQAGVGEARALVVAIADAAASRQIVALARNANPALRIIVRTRYVKEIAALHRLGADDVVPEEFETSLELAGRVLETFGAPRHLIAREKAALRREQYGMLLAADQPGAVRPLDSLLADSTLQERMVGERALAHGKSLRQLDLRGRTGASVLAIQRSGAWVSNPEPDFALASGDVVLLIGSAAAIEATWSLFEA